MKISKLAGVVCGAAFLLGSRSALADISIGDSGATVDFTNFVGGFAPTPTAGQLSSNDWAISGFSDGDLNFGSTNTSPDYTRGATLGTEGGIYSPTSGSKFLGIRLSDADFSPGVITARFKSTVAHPLVRLAIAYDVLTFNDGPRSSSLNFSWSTDGSTFTAPGGAVDHTTPIAATTPTPAWVVTNKTTTLTNIRIATNGLLYLRWTSDDVAGTGSRDAIGLDNITITPQNGCGDGVAAGAEGCDDGNSVNTDACTNACTQAVCGDDIVRTGVEECDGTVCCGAENTPSECERLTGTTCPGGMCSNGTCMPNAAGGNTGNGGESGGDGMAGDTSMAGESGMGGEGGTAAGRGGRTGRGGRGGMGGDATGGVPAAGTSGAPAAGTAGAPTAGTTGSGGAATAGASSGGAGAGGRTGTAGSGNTGGAGKGGSGGSAAKPPSSSSSDDDSGCGCSVPRGSNHGTLALVLAGALLTFLRRRRSS